MDLVERICTAYAWQRALGHETTREPLCTVVRDAARPQLLGANHVSLVRAYTRAEIAQVFERADRAFALCDHRLFLVDPLTPPTFVARLAQDDYTELTPTIQLVLEGEVPAAALPAIEIRTASDEDDWRSIEGLVSEDHSEDGRGEARPMPLEVTRAMVESFRGKAPACQFFIARAGRVDCAYGAGVLCDGAVGIVGDLFTLPPYRRRGIASALIAHAATHLRARGAAQVAIGAHAGQRPKHLYGSLGFAPLCVTREYLAHAAGR